jgi:hypothetical protein
VIPSPPAGVSRSRPGFRGGDGPASQGDFRGPDPQSVSSASTSLDSSGRSLANVADQVIVRDTVKPTSRVVGYALARPRFERRRERALDGVLGVGGRVAHSLAGSSDARAPVTAVALASVYLTTLLMTTDWAR